MVVRTFTQASNNVSGDMCLTWSSVTWALVKARAHKKHLIIKFDNKTRVVRCFFSPPKLSFLLAVSYYLLFDAQKLKENLTTVVSYYDVICDLSRSVFRDNIEKINKAWKGAAEMVCDSVSARHQNIWLALIVRIQHVN